MPIEKVLESFPEHADELQPLLETAVQARPRSEDNAVPYAAMSHSRTRMLVRAEQLRREKSTRFGGAQLRRFAMQLVAFFVVAGVSLTSLVAASAQTLPGDGLYTIKRVAEVARLNTTSPEVRANLEDIYRTRRIEEVQELLQLRRAAPVIFEGVVTAQSETSWEIAGFSVTIPDTANIVGNIMTGMFVEVRGQTFENGEIRAETIYLRAYAFMGTLEAINGQIWLVSSVPVLVTAESQLAPGVTIGTRIVVLAQMDDQGTVSARAILLSDGSAGGSDTTEPAADATTTASPVDGTPAPVTPAPESDPETTEIDDDDGTDGPDDDGSDDDDGTDEPDDDGPDDDDGDDDNDDKTDEPDDDDNSGSGSGDDGDDPDDDSSGSGSGDDGDDPDDDNSGSGSGDDDK